MANLLLRGHEVHTVFDLLGTKENDITYALGWALARSDRLLSALLNEVFDLAPGEVVAVRLQEFSPGGGFTDIEVETEKLHLIIEAKRGWSVPETKQLELYAPRFLSGRANAIVSMSECSPQWASPRLPTTVGDGIPVKHLSWKRVTKLAAETGAGGGHAEKRVVREFARYLRGLMTMQNTTSNMVYVVSLGLDELFGSSVSFADIVVEHDRYFHPMGGGPRRLAQRTAQLPRFPLPRQAPADPARRAIRRAPPPMGCDSRARRETGLAEESSLRLQARPANSAGARGQDRQAVAERARLGRTGSTPDE